MEKQISNQEMLSMIMKLQAQVNKLQEDFEDSGLSEDDVLTEDDIIALRKADEEYEKGETFSWEDIERERRENGLD